MSVRIEVWGDYACFSRPELKTERVSYDVMTPSAARGIVEAILWHPGLRWHIDKIYVRAPIRFTNIRRNEVKDVVSGRKLKTIMEKGSGGRRKASAIISRIWVRGNFRRGLVFARRCHLAPMS